MITLYLYDNIIQSKEKEEIKEHILPEEALDYGKIKNIFLFESHLEKLAKKEKWLTLFKSRKLIIILPSNYTSCDKEILNVILQNIGFQNIKFICEKECLNLKKDQIIAIVHKKYLVTLKKDSDPMTYPYYIFQNMKNTLDFLIKKNSKKYHYILIGNCCKIIEYAESKKTNNIHYYQEYSEYIINNAIPK